MKLAGIREMEFGSDTVIVFKIEYYHKTYKNIILYEGNGKFSYKIDTRLQEEINENQKEAILELVKGIERFSIFK